jgi:hypothetical protein
MEAFCPVLVAVPLPTEKVHMPFVVVPSFAHQPAISYGEILDVLRFESIDPLLPEALVNEVHWPIFAVYPLLQTQPLFSV